MRLAKMPTMTKPKRSDYTLRIRTARTIYDGFQDLMHRVAKRRLAPLPQNAKGTVEAVLSAIILEFLERSEADQDAVIRRLVPEFARRVKAEFPDLDDPDADEAATTSVHRDPGASPRRKPAG